MFLKKHFLLFLLTGWTVYACAARTDPNRDAFSTETPTPLPSSTVVWFPPSNTPSPQVFSTHPPTPEMRPGIGSISITDDFSVPDLWNIASSNDANSIVSDNHLTLTVQPGVYMYSLRQDLILGNFYVEITAQPKLCRDKDEYGFIARGNAVAYYRFALTCNGRVRAERVSGQQRHPLQEPMLSGDVPLGAPGETRIAVWALGNEMRLFLNDRYQFNIVDQNYLSGTLGVFARASGDTPITIVFSDLVVYDLTLAPPTKTPRP